ncbi:hypothetical protein JCM10207_005232, partial [Rhodosporidiobolus poonsookiae]
MRATLVELSANLSTHCVLPAARLPLSPLIQPSPPPTASPLLAFPASETVLSTAMPFGQVVIGPPGSGKTTYVWGLYQFFTALSRPILLVNLDPASPSPPYPGSISIASLISLDDAMSAHKLGPNGAMLYCLEYLEANLDWLEEELEQAMGRMERGEGGKGEGEGGGDEMELDELGQVRGKRTCRREECYVVFDTPGQVELSTDHGSLKRIMERLQKKMGFR